jgi:AbrB family looped-hinge helix DNA binding protein
METTKLSSKGQVIIPKPLRKAYHWEAGQELVVIDTGNGILLKPKTAFPETNIEDVISYLKYSGKTISIDDMEQAIQQGIKERFSDCD